MSVTRNRSISETVYRLAFSAAIGAQLFIGCTNADLPPAAFRCTDEAGTCPAGYTCRSGVCASADTAVPLALSPEIIDGDANFTVHPRANDLLICWNVTPSATTAGIFAATVTPSGEFGTTPRAVYTPEVGTSTELTGVRGDCAWNGDRVLIGVTRITGHDSFVYRIFSTDLETGASRSVVDEPPYAENVFVGIRTANVGNTVWFPQLQFVARGVDASHVAYGLLIQGEVPSSYGRTPTPAMVNALQPTAVSFFAGTDGAWLSVQLPTGVPFIQWLSQSEVGVADASIQQKPWILHPAIDFIRAVPLAVRGSDLAIAYELTLGTWQIYWMPSNASTGGMDAGAPGALAVAGPVLHLSPGVLQPAGLVDGDQLLFAGSPAATDAGAGEFSVWSVPWGQTTDFVPYGTVSKLSSLPTRHVELSRVGSSLLAVWTEQVPATSDTASYVSLQAAPVVQH